MPLTQLVQHAPSTGDKTMREFSALNIFSSEIQFYSTSLFTHSLEWSTPLLFLHSSFVSYTMAVIAVNFVVPLSVMFYCYYNVSVTVRRYKASNCLESINIDWSDQMDVTKVKTKEQLFFQGINIIIDCIKYT